MVRKALIPIAGLGTRMGPLARAVPKAMFPLVDAAGKVRPIIHYILSEAYSAGIEQMGLIVSPAHLDLLRKYFTSARKEPDGEMLAGVEFINQPAPMGFGEAVARGATFVGDEPFMLLLGDHVYKADSGAPSCAAQVAAAFKACDGCAMVGMQPVGPEELPKVGTAGGEAILPRPGLDAQLASRIYRCRSFIEKPRLDLARQELRTPGLGEDQFLAHCGIYIFTAELFDCLARLAVQDRPMGQEIQLAEAQEMLLELHPENYHLYRIAGRAFDTGVPQGYLAAQDAIRE
jgi:UTP--glucose-1-phosphate uridylyltransferase